MEEDGGPARVALLAMAQLEPSGLILTDAAGVTRWANAAMQRLCGYSLAELVDRTPGSVLQGPETNRESVRVLRAAVRDQRAVSVEILNYHRSGCEYWQSIDIVPLRDSAGVCRGFIGVQNDVAARRRLDAELVDAAAREQRRLAAALHDGIGQQLTGLILLAGAVQSTHRHSGRLDAVALAQIVATAQAAVRECRRLAVGLPGFADHAHNASAVLAAVCERVLGPGVHASIHWDARVTAMLARGTFHEVYFAIEDMLRFVGRDATLTHVDLRGQLHDATIHVLVADSTPRAALVRRSRADVTAERRRMIFRAARLGGSVRVAADPTTGRVHISLEMPVPPSSPAELG